MLKSFLGFFCDDIRLEQGGKETVVGILRDNMIVPAVPGLIPKLGVYFRFMMDPKAPPPSSIAMALKMPWEEIVLGQAGRELIQKAIDNARENNLPTAGIVLRALLAPLQVKNYGLIQAVARIDGEEQVCAILNIKPPSALANASASEQPA